MNATSGWVKKTQHTKGQDPLGVQAPCISIYQQLMPGITNVTDRARYYSFYPWLVWAADQAAPSRTVDEFVDWVRRGDCLFSMIAVRHRVTSGDDSLNLHDGGMIGTQTLRGVVSRLRDDEVLDLTQYSTMEPNDGKRYFQNRLGGLGQYYLGTLTELGLMGRFSGVIGFTPAGEDLAVAFDVAVDRDLFVDTLRDGVITNDRLDALASFCPCCLKDAEDEHGMLVDLFFGPDIPGVPDEVYRRSTLLAHLDLLDVLGGETAYGERVFRASTYAGAVPSGEAWSPAGALSEAREGWAAYQANELLSYATQTVFWTAWRMLERSSDLVPDAATFGAWFSRDTVVRNTAEGLGSPAFEGALATITAQLPALTDLASPDHEINLLSELQSRVAEPDGSDRDRLVLAARILLSVCARERGEAPYGRLGFPLDYFRTHPINLISLGRLAADEWVGLSMSEWFGWLASRWGVEAHLRVALRKLRYQPKDTFHVVPTDNGLKVVAEPTPVFTTPRFATTTQVLQDLGATARTPDGQTTALTEFGRSLMVAR